MKIQLNDKNEIIGCTRIGDINDSIDYDGELPGDFWRNFRPTFYLLKNNMIVENPDYVEPTPGLPTGPTSLQQVVMQQAKTIVQMQSVMMQQSTDIAELKGENA